GVGEAHRRELHLLRDVQRGGGGEPAARGPVRRAPQQAAHGDAAPAIAHGHAHGRADPAVDGPRTDRTEHEHDHDDRAGSHADADATAAGTAVRAAGEHQTVTTPSDASTGRASAWPVGVFGCRRRARAYVTTAIAI